VGVESFLLDISSMKFSYLEIYLKIGKFLPLCFKPSFSLSDDSTYFCFEVEQRIIKKIKFTKISELPKYNFLISYGRILPFLLAEYGHAFLRKETELG